MDGDFVDEDENVNNEDDGEDDGEDDSGDDVEDGGDASTKNGQV